MAHFHAVDPRAVLMEAVDIGPLAVDKPWQDRPQENPANNSITCGAGDAGGISMGSVIVDNRLFPAYLRADLKSLQSRLKRCCSRRTDPHDPEGLTDERRLKSAPTHTEIRTTLLMNGTEGSQLLPSPAPHTGEGGHKRVLGAAQSLLE
jgi:hypothetical protein